MKYLVVFFLLGSSAFAGGGIWVLEINFLYEGEYQSGFVYADYWANDFEAAFAANDSLFTAEFHRRYEEQSLLKVYQRIIDHSYIARNAPFPNQGFEVEAESEIIVPVQALDLLCLHKVWVKSDYHIVVLNALSPADTTWFSNEYIRSSPLGDEAGCRLEVYDFGQMGKAQKPLSELVNLYEKRGPYLPPDDAMLQKLLARLSKLKLVVVELCGC